LFARPKYLFQHRSRFQQYLPVIEPKDHQPLFLKKNITASITFGVLALKVLAAIHLNHQLCCGSIEIDDIRAHRFLPVELDSKKVLAP